MARKKNNYVNNADFYAAMKQYKDQVDQAEAAGKPAPRIPNYIGECIYEIANRLSYKPNFINYPFREEMIGDGMENAIMAINNFNPDKSKNPFAYFTQIIYFAFVRRIQKEKKQLYIKHKTAENTALFDEVASGDSEHATMDYQSEYMDDFVREYERKLEEKKEKAK